VAEGAEYKPHWLFIKPEAKPPPQVANKAWPQNPIDNFVLARLEKEKLKPSPRADKYTLVRRLYLDLIGLPPTPAEADAFVNDTSANAYEKLVDKLLASPHYGERWARRWLDLARYADTNGLRRTARAMYGPGAIGSLMPSTRACPSMNSRSSKLRATCCRTRRPTKSSPPACIEIRC